MKKSKRVMLGESIQAIIKSTGQNETTDSVLVNRDIIPTILNPDFMAGSLYSKCKVFNVGDNTSGAKIPITSEVTRTIAAGIKGGVIGYWVGEGVAKTPSTAGFSILDLGFNKICVVIPLTDEIKQDSEMLGQYVGYVAQEAIKYYIDNAIVFGNGSQMNGIVSHACTGSSAIAGALTAANLKDIYDLYYGGSDGCWVFSQDMWVEVTNLWDAVATQAPGIPLTWNANGQAILWGLPVVVNSAMNDRTILIGDFTQYTIIQKEMTQAVNESLKFVEDESYLRFVLRINGSPTWVGAKTLNDSSVVHPFVIATGMEQSSSSSSSSSGGHSSSSSSEEHSSSSSSSVDSSSSKSSESVGNTSSSSSSSSSGV